jgi:hypothetical protein
VTSATTQRPRAGALGLGLAALAATMAPASAEAYCRTASCDDGAVGARCVPAQPNDCGVPLAWPSSCVGYSLQRDASSQLALDDVRPIAARAFGAWSAVACGTGTPSILAAPLADVACARAEYVEDGPNANVVVFRDAAWPYPASAALALTTVTYVLDSGEIRDADLEINSADATLTTSDTNVEVDLESILTHEAGHVLGLAHSSTEGATMVTDYPPQSLELRTLDADDLAAICATYPPGEKRLCDATPRNGLGIACDGGESAGGGADTDHGDDDAGCAVATTAGRASRGGLGVAFAIAASALARRPRRRAR